MSLNDCVFESIDQVQAWVLSRLLRNGTPVTSRGMPTLELFPVSFSLANPRKRCVTTPERRWSLPLALGEFCWHAIGSNHVNFIEYYAPRWRDFTDGSTILGSCYGHHIFESSNGLSQWERLRNLLKIEPNSRRAVLQLFTADLGLDPDTKDAPCTCCIQFLLRDGKLHGIVYMRSNDAIWGLPYDVFLFTMLQELLSRELDVELGSYFHTAGSLHLYERHFDLARRILSCSDSLEFEMPPMCEHQQLNLFLRCEEAIRTGQSPPDEANTLDPYWGSLLEVLKWYSLRKATNANNREKISRPEGPFAPLLRLQGVPDGNGSGRALV